MAETVVMGRELYDRLVTETRRRHPHKTFGYLLARSADYEPCDFILFDENIRNSEIWQPEFHSYGDYFVDHPDAGFVATPEESWRVQKEIWSRGLYEVGVLHTHQRHPANFSQIDWDMHRQRFSGLWHLIVSLRNPQMPQVRPFAITEDSVRELPLLIPERHESGSAPRKATLKEAAELLRDIRHLGPAGYPPVKYADEIMLAIGALQDSAGQHVVDDLLADSLLRGAAERFARYIEPLMVAMVNPAFEMGSDRREADHFYGERPSHHCELSTFEIMRVPVTNALFSLIEPGGPGPSLAASSKPAVKVTWSEAALFGLWMGCRLPTEAEWEFCCGAGSSFDWCCESESDLRRYAWYCANARDQVHPVATREPNQLGLFDLHGNVWEWCQDDYDQDFYRSAPALNPVNQASTWTGAGMRAHKVVRGGSMNALGEMCRTRFRIHEQVEFRAADLGFRLARSRESQQERCDQ